MGEKLSQLTKASLEALIDDEIEYEIYMYILTKIIGQNYDKQYDIVSKLPNGLKYLFVSCQLENEVHNGGFNQYFYNTCGEFIDEAIEAFYYFGLPKLAEVVIKAANVVIEEKDIHVASKKEGTLEAFCDSYKYTKLGTVDDEFYDCADSISIARIKKIRENINGFLI